ncbi:MAG TPA: hypothetical protein VLH58_03555 [Candidatus Methylomirabilis sp.]|nr:hypothetical protein [Candidatus Methylomirabilis sp.]HSC70400.1 hypothetical protein [Candidatus Methylomirabilis sp.]
MALRKRIGGRVAVGLCLLLVVLAVVPAGAASGRKSRDLAVLDHERWLDTLKGTVKNFSKANARDVTVVVKFLDKKRKPLGTQRVGVGDLNSGEQSSWSLAIEERNRPAKSYQFEIHAIWR